MKRLISLLLVLLEEFGQRCGTSTTQDAQTLLRRFEHEGDSFLTITLPDFGKAFERWLDLGQIVHERPLGFTLMPSGSPHFLRGFLALVFDTNDGRLLAQPSTEAIQAIRQLTLMFGKVNLDCSPERERKAVDDYVQCDIEVRQNSEAFVKRSLRGEEACSKALSGESYDFHDPVDPAFVRVAGLLWGRLFSSVDTRIHNEGLFPRHSSGATADRLRGNSKYTVKQWTARLERVFPHWEALIPNLRFLDRIEDVTPVLPDAERPVKVVTVPKTLKTPRIIAEEPTCMQYVQQGILQLMREEIRRDDNARNLVMFDSQEPNQLLAKRGSLSGDLATLDLSEASDRVSIVHVKDLLARHTVTREAVFASRSLKARVPRHGVITLAKFASMGSALTFPIESLVFMTVIFVGIEQALNRPLTMQDVRSLYGKVRVYGDDIIIPTDYVQPVLGALEAYGFKVNRNKSFWTGKFRESCGSEWYDGVDVSIVRCRTLLPVNRQDVQELQSTVSFRNLLYKAGLWKGAAYLDELVRDIIPFPNIEETSALLGRLSVFPNREFRWDDDLHVPLVRGVVVVSEPPVSPLDDYGALMKCFLKDAGESQLPSHPGAFWADGPKPFQDVKHLARAGRPNAARIKVRWTRPW